VLQLAVEHSLQYLDLSQHLSSYVCDNGGEWLGANAKALINLEKYGFDCVLSNPLLCMTHSGALLTPAAGFLDSSEFAWSCKVHDAEKASSHLLALLRTQAGADHDLEVKASYLTNPFEPRETFITKMVFRGENAAERVRSLLDAYLESVGPLPTSNAGRFAASEWYEQSDDENEEEDEDGDSDADGNNVADGGDVVELDVQQRAEQSEVLGLDDSDDEHGDALTGGGGGGGGDDEPEVRVTRQSARLCASKKRKC
jgi:hypothetical protein